MVSRIEERIKHSRLITVILLIVIMYMVVTVTWAASYSVIAADDISDAVKIGAFNEPIPYFLKCCLAYIKSIYLGWQGTYSAMLIQSVLSPLNNYGFPQLRCIMTINALFFFAALLFFALSLFRTIDKEYRNIKLFMLMILVFCICGYQSYYEIFTWFTGAANYTFPLSFLLIGLACFVEMDGKHWRMFAVISLIFGAFAMGGSLAVSAVGCTAAMLFSLYYYHTNRETIKRRIAITSTWIIFACVNVFAPGNFVRHDAIDSSGLHPIDAFCDAISMTDMRWQYLLGTNLVFVLVVVFGTGFYLGERKSGTDHIDTKLKISIVSLLTPIIVSFPVALGYSTINIPDRCAFVLDLSILLSSGLVTMFTGMKTAELVEKDQKRLFVQIYLIIATVILLSDGYGLADVKIREISSNLKNGVYREHYYECKKFMEKLGEYERNTDVRIPRSEVPREIDNVFNFVIEDEEDWKNYYLAKYFGFNSIYEVDDE